MADKFTSEHFKLLNKWRGQKRDDSNPEQNHAYEELKNAYRATKSWAEQVKAELAPSGYVDIRKRPTNQANAFQAYNWARIYPQKGSPKALAYTVGIEADRGFVVKIDLVNTQIEDTSLRQKYEQLRGNFTSSGIVAITPIAEGLKMEFADLVAWSVDAAKNFRPSYDEMAQELGLDTEQSVDELMSHFHGHEDFVRLQPLWTNKTKDLFDRLARAVNEMGLDWWFTRATNSQLRFGRKEKKAVKGKPVGWLFLRADGIRIGWMSFAGLEKLDSTHLTSELVELFEAADKDEGFWPPKLGERSGRDGYWPDDYDIEVVTPNDKLPENIIYYGPPGTGKTLQLQGLLKDKYTDRESGDEYFEFVTFHQSYGYEEFVEGLRPVVTRPGKKRVANSEENSVSSGEVRYEIKPGAFLKLCERARQDTSKQYAIVIDEINRGNISKIFGELITLVEVDKRESGDYPAKVTLPYSCESFSVPSNVDVIGTMNTADRSLALIDTALRRRFEFIPLMPDPSVLADATFTHDGVTISVEEILVMINKRIEALYDRDHMVGHAYFTRIKTLKNEERFNELKKIFQKKIIPLLEEYFFDDWQKIRLVLGDNQKQKQPHLQFVKEVSNDHNFSSLFGNGDELDQYTPSSRYQLNAEALNHPAAFIGIYSPKSENSDE
jgi:5-methylcytosine-specific restriction protein B